MSRLLLSSLHSTKIGFQPKPSKYFLISSFGFLERSVGFEIFPPFKCNIGSIAPSFTGLIKAFENQLVASGPVSASPSPTTAAQITSGLSNIAPVPWLIEYPNSPPS